MSDTSSIGETYAVLVSCQLSFFDWFLKEIPSSPSGNMLEICLESFRRREVWGRLPRELISLGDWYDPGLQHAGMMQVCACVEIMFNQGFSWWRGKTELWEILRNNSVRYNCNSGLFDVAKFFSISSNYINFFYLDFGTVRKTKNRSHLLHEFTLFKHL